MGKTKNVTLKSWITKTTAKTIAEKMSVTPVVVNLWRRGRRPAAKHMIAINKLSKGAVTYQQMIEQHGK